MAITDDAESRKGDCSMDEFFVPTIVPNEPYTARSLDDVDVPTFPTKAASVLPNQDNGGENLLRSDSVSSIERRRPCNINVDNDFQNRPPPFWCSLKRFFQSFIHTMSIMRLLLLLTRKDFKQRPCTYVLGFLAVFVIVAFSVVLLSVLTYLPLAFLELAEGQVGQMDLIITPGGLLSNAPSINYSKVKKYFPPLAGDIGYHAPRLLGSMSAIGVKQCSGEAQQKSFWNYCDYAASCINTYCNTTLVSTLDVFVLDTALENKIGIGASSDPELKPGEVIVSEQVEYVLNTSRVGDTIILFGNMKNSLNAAFSAAEVQSQNSYLLFLKVAKVIHADVDRFRASKKFVILNYNTFLETLAQNLPETYPQWYADRLASASLDPGVTQVIFNMPQSVRSDAYSSTNYNTLRYKFALWAQNIILPIGLTQISLVTPILTYLYKLRMVNMFIGLIMSLVILGVGFLSCVLIYSLLSVGVETRTYTVGIQRMMGFTRSNTVALLMMNVFSFTLVGCIGGLFAGQGLYMVVSHVLRDTTNISMPKYISWKAAVLGSCAGCFVSFLAALFPARSVILLRLPDILDASRTKMNGVVFKVRKRGAEPFNVKLSLFGLLLAVLGFLVYYVFPTSLVTVKLQIMFYFFFSMLISLLAGCVLLMLSFERPIQSAMSYLFFFWETNAVFRIVQINLTAHRLDNRRTTIMFAMSMAFIIFLTVAFETQLNSLTSTYVAQLGGDIGITLSSINFLKFCQIMQELRATIPEGTISGLTYRVQAKNTLDGNCNVSYKLETLGRYVSANVTLEPIPPNFFEELFSQYMTVDHYDKEAERYGLSAALYSREGMSSVIMSTSAYDALQISNPVDSVLMSTISGCGSMVGGRTPIKTMAALSASPVLKMSSVPGKQTNAVASLPNVARLLGIQGASVLSFNVNEIILRVPDPRNYAVLNEFFTKFFSKNQIWMSLDTADDVSTLTTTASNIVNKFFYLIEIIVLLICFLSLTSSQTSNILRSSKEIAIFLCLGMTHFQIYRIYIWESFIIVITSALMGLLVGVIVASTMSIQNVLFSTQATPLQFPYIQMAIIVVLGFIFALVTGAVPVSHLLKLPSISHLLRRSLT